MLERVKSRLTRISNLFSIIYALAIAAKTLQTVLQDNCIRWALSGRAGTKSHRFHKHDAKIKQQFHLAECFL